MARYDLKVVAEFSAAHALRGYKGSCARTHGHNWRVEVEIRSEVLNEIGLALDFRTVRGWTDELLEQLDHRNLNDLEPFQTVNPTAENVAAFFYDRLATRLADHSAAPGSTLRAVTIWENDRCSVRYSEA